MSNTIKEQLSTFIDGELPDAERELLQRRLEVDGDLQGTWQRYHLIRDAMREDLPEFTSRALDTAYQDKDVPVSTGVLRKIVRPVAGLVVAASVAGLAVLGVLDSDHDDGRMLQQTAPEVAVNQSQPASLSTDSLAVSYTRQALAKPAMTSHLNVYLVDHSSYSGFGASQSIIPYSRVVGYDQPVRGQELKDNLDEERRYW